MQQLICARDSIKRLAVWKIVTVDCVDRWRCVIEESLHVFVLTFLMVTKWVMGPPLVFEELCVVSARPCCLNRMLVIVLSRVHLGALVVELSDDDLRS